MAIPSNTATMIHIGEVKETIGMSSRAEDFAFLAETLNGLYSRPIEAIIREMSTNAHDSHVEAGVTRPIEVTLPTSNSLTLVIEDFGLGMSVDDLRETYANYGASSKRGSNAVAGQLGLGSKSPLSYADLFTVVGVKGGVKVIAYVTKDRFGVGEIQIKDTLATNEPNGVRIMIPVEADDVWKFSSAAKALFQFWTPGSVLVDGEAPEVPAWTEGALHIDNDTMLVRPDSGLHSSYVIMGNVAYPVEDATVGRHERRFVARLNIGDVNFVASREDVKNDAWTTETLGDLSHYIRTNFRRILNGAIEGAAHAWEETQFKMLWGAITETVLRPSDPDRRIWTYDPSGYRRKCKALDRYTLKAMAQNSNTVVITGYTAKTLSATAKERLDEMFGRDKNFVVLPVGTNGVASIDGRPDTYRWAEVVEATARPRAARGEAKPKAETIYHTTSGGMTAQELADSGMKVLYSNPGEYRGYGDLGAIVVNVYSCRQLDRLTRYVPDITWYHAELANMQSAAKDAITDHDRDILSARRLPAVFRMLPADEIKDSTLAKHIRLSQEPDTDTMKAASDLGLYPDSPELPDYDSLYPLCSGGRYATQAAQEDRVLYINAKFTQVAAQAFVSALTQGAA